MKLSILKHRFLFGLIAIVIATFSCKQIQYQEFNTFGSGKTSGNHPIYSKTKNADLSTLVNNHIDQIDSIKTLNDAITTTHPESSALQKSNSSVHQNSRKSLNLNELNQAFNAIPKTKATNFKDLIKEYKNKKQIFNYEGDNFLMYFGFNILMYSIVVGLGLAFLGVLAETTGKDNGLFFSILGLGIFGFGAMIGGGIWLIGAIASLFQ